MEPLVVKVNVMSQTPEQEGHLLGLFVSHSPIRAVLISSPSIACVCARVHVCVCARARVYVSARALFSVYYPTRLIPCLPRRPSLPTYYEH